MKLDEPGEAQLDWIKRYLSQHKNTIKAFLFFVTRVTSELRNALHGFDYVVDDLVYRDKSGWKHA